MKNNIFIIGDSYSTYEGYIPDGYHTYYSDERKDEPVVKGVDKTWWSILAKDNKLNIVLNDSFSGSTVCNTVRPALTVDTSFISRMDKYISEGFFEKNTVDTIFIFGGTNDSWIDAPIGDVKYSDWTDEELKCVLPAFCYLVDRAKTVVKNIIVVVNSDLKPEITNGFKQVCEKNNVTCICLEQIDKQKSHPTELGMKQIASQVTKAIG